MSESSADYSDLVAVYINCTLKRSPAVSHTQGLMDRSIDLMRAQGVSVTRRLIERLYAMSGLFNDKGRYVYYGKVGGTLITGNEDGVKHAAMANLYSLQHIGSPFRRPRTPAGSARSDRGRVTWTRAPADRRTTSPTATPPS